MVNFSPLVVYEANVVGDVRWTSVRDAADDNTDENVDDGDMIRRRDDNGRVRSAADHVTMKLAIVADDYELTTTSITFYDCTVHSSYVS